MTRTKELVQAIQAGQTRAVVARIYAKGIGECHDRRDSDYVDWSTVNRAALKRWKPSGLNWIKKMAWHLWQHGEQSDMKHKPRLDANHRSIVKALRQVGASVHSLASVGDGCPDLLVGWRGKNYIFEVKVGWAPLTRAEWKWVTEWRGPKVIVRSVDEALAELGVRHSHD